MSEEERGSFQPASTVQLRRLLIVSRDSELGNTLAESLRNRLEGAEIRLTDPADEGLRHESCDLVLVICGPSMETDIALSSVVRHFPKGAPVVVQLVDEPTAGNGLVLKQEAFVLVGDRHGPSRALTDVLFEALTWAQGAARSKSGAPQADLHRLRTTLARVNHDIKNPLSIISGNAQLLGELANIMNFDEDVVQPIRDIEEASQRIAGMLHELQEVAAMTRAERPSRTE